MSSLLTEWATRWNIPHAALADLIAQQFYAPPQPSGLSESAVQSLVRIEAAQKGVRLWRNNVGAGKLENGLFMRWGLANDSAQLNSVIKSGDLIGLRPVYIRSHHIGSTIGQFVSREVKAAGWQFRGTDTENAQAMWATLINACGGDAQIISKTGSL